MRGFIHEIRRRNVHRVALAYLGAAWLLVQILETVLPVYEVDDAVIRWVILALLVAFLPILAVAWAFEWTAKGIRTQEEVDRDPELASRSSRRADRVIIAVLSPVGSGATGAGEVDRGAALRRHEPGTRSALACRRRR